ncbi:hypothetical protein FHS15_004967 [Paenibacillus castaneae]|nr:hypothetical protein [Paenibacillus castaneae]
MDRETFVVQESREIMLKFDVFDSDNIVEFIGRDLGY